MKITPTESTHRLIMASHVASHRNGAGQALLTALQDFITPLVQMVDPVPYNDRRPVEQAAKNLIGALQEFISKVVRSSQAAAPRTNDENRNNTLNTPTLPDNNSDQVMSAVITSYFSSGLIGQGHRNAGNPAPRLDSHHRKALTVLREHVFNAMPIRLLHFESQGSEFKISLVERDAIYAYLQATFERNVIDQPYGSKPRLNTTIEADRAIQELISAHAGYAILSHTWLRSMPGEVTYGDWTKGHFDVNSPGYQKLANFCKSAWKDYGLTFGWMDTVCINKDSSSELDESIRSMYNWYARSDMCIVYLAETITLSGMHIDPWFTRAWTLQELLAPSKLKLYNFNWQQLVESSDNDKIYSPIAEQIERATTISMEELHNIHWSPFSRRMQLAAPRQVTREEDTAYSLMGIFNVSITTAYGEGAQRAFFRLLQEILATSFHVLDLFNWAGSMDPHRAHPSTRLPSGPRPYLKRCTDSTLSLGMPIEPVILTHLGLRIPVILMRALSTSPSHLRPYKAIGNFCASANINPIDSSTYPSTYYVLDQHTSDEVQDGLSPNFLGLFQITLAVVNFSQHSEEVRVPRGSIFIPETCFAIPMLLRERVESGIAWDFLISTIETREPVVFQLNVIKRTGLGHPRVVDRDRLKDHGMQLTTSLYI